MSNSGKVSDLRVFWVPGNPTLDGRGDVKFVPSFVTLGVAVVDLLDVHQHLDLEWNSPYYGSTIWIKNL